MHCQNNCLYLLFEIEVKKIDNITYQIDMKYRKPGLEYLEFIINRLQLNLICANDIRVYTY